MPIQMILLLFFSAVCGAFSVGLAIRLSTPHVHQGRMFLKICLGTTLYIMVKTCLAALALLV